MKSKQKLNETMETMYNLICFFYKSKLQGEMNHKRQRNCLNDVDYLNLSPLHQNCVPFHYLRFNLPNLWFCCNITRLENAQGLWF